MDIWKNYMKRKPHHNQKKLIERLCLKCNIKFKSHGNHNRMCNNCRK